MCNRKSEVCSTRPTGAPHSQQPVESAHGRHLGSRTFRGRQQKVSVVVPARNDAEGIGVVLEHSLPYADEPFVVDGHSINLTLEIAETFGARVVSYNGRCSGDALRDAIETVTGDIATYIDANHSHRPSYVPRLVAPIPGGWSTNMSLATARRAAPANVIRTSKNSP